MKIKDRIALYFTMISTTMLFAVLCMVYFTFTKFMQTDFFERLTDRAMVTAKLYLEADEISPEALNKVRHKYLQKLNGEVVRIYNFKNQASFIGDDNQYWAKTTINQVRKQKHLQYVDKVHQVVGIYYKDNQGDFVILVSATDTGTKNRLDKLLKSMAIIFFTIFIILLLTSRWIAAKMLQPLTQFMQQLGKVGSKNLEFRVEETAKNDEINSIAKRFNQLIAELEQAFILQRTFVANASHELRTPVTRMMMTAELALSKDREKSKYQQAINSMLEDAGKMDDTITALLVLAQMDLSLATTQENKIAVDTLLASLEKYWKDEKKLAFELKNECTIADGSILANQTLLEIALNNIISNGFKFSNNMPVVCHLSCSDETLQIKISDKGPGIAPQYRTEVFNPFYTKSFNTNQKGQGMGLYMAKKIIVLFKGEITIDDDQGPGNTIIVSLPIF